MAVTDRKLIAAMMLVEVLKSAEAFARKAELDEIVLAATSLRIDAERAVRVIAQHVAEK